MGGPLEVPGQTAAQASEPQTTQEAVDAGLSQEGQYPPDLAVESEPDYVQEQYSQQPSSQAPAAAPQTQSPQAALPGDIDLAF